MEYKTKQVGECEIILSKGKAVSENRLICDSCEGLVYQCHFCGCYFYIGDEVLCDDDNHHWHIGCEK